MSNKSFFGSFETHLVKLISIMNLSAMYFTTRRTCRIYTHLIQPVKAILQTIKKEVPFGIEEQYFSLRNTNQQTSILFLITMKITARHFAHVESLEYIPST